MVKPILFNYINCNQRWTVNVLVYNLMISKLMFVLISFFIDFVKVGLISLPFFNLWYHYGTWTFGEFACKTWLVIDYTACTQSMIAIILISWDRLWMVSRMKSYLNNQTNRLAVIIILSSWAFWYIYYSLLVSFGSGTVEGHVIDYSQDCDMHINYRLDYTLFEIVGLFTIPMLIIVGINFKLYVDVRNSWSKSPSELYQYNRKSAAKTLVFLVTAYMICWLPYHIVLLMETVHEGSVAAPIVAFVEYLLWINSAINPFLYVCTNPLFRQQLEKMFVAKGCRSTARESTGSYGTTLTMTAILTGTQSIHKV